MCIFIWLLNEFSMDCFSYIYIFNKVIADIYYYFKSIIKNNKGGNKMKYMIQLFIIFLFFGINVVHADNICIEDFKNNGKIELEEVIYLIKRLTDDYELPENKYHGQGFIEDSIQDASNKRLTYEAKKDGVNIYTNTYGMTFVYIEPGAYTMGSPTNEEGRYLSETEHLVTLTNGFYLQTTEVTQG